MRPRAFLMAVVLVAPFTCLGQQETAADSVLLDRLLDAALQDCDAYDFLRQLTTTAPHRLSGSSGAAEALLLVRKTLENHGFEPVVVESLLVPHWDRGSVEEAVAYVGDNVTSLPLAVCALGGSIGTLPEGVEGELVEVSSFDELRALGESARGKIVLLNRPMDPTLVSTFAAYGGAVDQRSRGAIEAARQGAIAVLVRSMTLSRDTTPHTGSMHYASDVPKIPAAAVSTAGADLLSAALHEASPVRVHLRLSCKTLPDAWSGNVYGQITGSEFPDEIIVVGGHLDAWDKGQGAHDDGAGCAQAFEVLNILKKAGIVPKRTIRAVFFMNEENGNRGGPAYASSPRRSGEHHCAAIESDQGGFTPRGLFVEADSATVAAVRRWTPLFERLGAGCIEPGGSGVDIDALVKNGVPGIGLNVDDARYFDYHHSDHDTIDKVHPRELEMGALVQTLLSYLISEQGITPSEKTP